MNYMDELKRCRTELLAMEINKVNQFYDGEFQRVININEMLIFKNNSKIKFREAIEKYSFIANGVYSQIDKKSAEDILEECAASHLFNIGESKINSHAFRGIRLYYNQNSHRSMMYDITVTQYLYECYEELKSKLAYNQVETDGTIKDKSFNNRNVLDWKMNKPIGNTTDMRKYIINKVLVEMLNEYKK